VDSYDTLVWSMVCYRHRPLRQFESALKKGSEENLIKV
jgi:hypothetical protein